MTTAGDRAAVSTATWTVELSGDRGIVEVTCNEIRVIDGALILSRAMQPAPEPMMPAMIFARGTWTLAHREGETALWTGHRHAPPPPRHGPIAR